MIISALLLALVVNSLDTKLGKTLCIRQGWKTQLFPGEIDKRLATPVPDKSVLSPFPNRKPFESGTGRVHSRFQKTRSPVTFP
jgi:hypothetical protein